MPGARHVADGRDERAARPYGVRMGLVDWASLPLSRAATSRHAERRTEPDLVDTVLDEPGTRVVLVHRGRVAVAPDARVLVRLPAAALAAAAPSVGTPLGAGSRPEWLYLGAQDLPDDEDVDPGAYLALLIPDEAGAHDVDLSGVPSPDLCDELVERHRWASLRDVGGTLSALDAGLATAAIALAAWHAAHPRCPRCGEPTESVHGGWVRRCTNDGTEHYPRTDAAVIMAVLDDDDRLLLGRSARWPERRYSTLAGYVEPGEPVEAAVRREVLEEVGVTVTTVDYRGSQPWPFPASLMLAFVARASSTAITVDGEEIAEARWFSREELADAVAGGDVLLPSRTSIARALIEDWYGASLSGSWDAHSG